MHVELLTAENIDLFTKYAQDHITDYLFFVLDYKYYPDKTQIYMAVDQHKNVLGMALYFKKELLSLRGSNETVEFLLKNFKLEFSEIMVPKSARSIVESLITSNSHEKETLRMVLKEEHLVPNIRDFSQIQLLDKNDAESIAKIMRLADPVYWGDRKAENILFDDVHVWYGKKEGKELISMVGVWKDPHYTFISHVATLPDYQNQGYASDLLYYALQQNLLETQSVFLHVRADNDVAIHTYTKAGFLKKADYYNLKK